MDGSGGPNPALGVDGADRQLFPAGANSGNPGQDRPPRGAEVGPIAKTRTVQGRDVRQEPGGDYLYRAG